jgi:hypothetical protein
VGWYAVAGTPVALRGSVLLDGVCHAYPFGVRVCELMLVAAGAWGEGGAARLEEGSQHEGGWGRRRRVPSDVSTTWTTRTAIHGSVSHTS